MSDMAIMGSAAHLVKEITARRLSATDAVRTSLSIVEKRDPTLRAFLEVHADAAIERAFQLDQQLNNGATPGPLVGVPVALKDNLCMTTGTTTCASAILHNFRAPYNAHIVEKLQAAGAVIIGKTNLDEFAMGSSTENSGRFTTLNPWALDRVPGGSSGGSAVAVAAGMTPLALGSETGGSVRQPASLCGVVGLKPTYGRISRSGLVAFASSLDQIGPFGRTAEDVALLMNVIAGRDARDSTSVNHPVPDYPAGLNHSLKGCRVGIAAEYFGEGLNPEVRAGVEAALETLKTEGAEVHEINLPHSRFAVAVYYLVATAEASSNLARYDGVRYGYRAPDPSDVIDVYAASREHGFGPEVKRRIMLGTYALSSGYYDAYYLKALKVRTLIKRDFDEAFKSVDVIASPTSPTTAFKIGEKSQDPLAMYLADIYTISANLAGICAISIPCGFDRAGLPIGLQLMGKNFAEDRLLNVAHQYQLRTEHHLKKPPITA